MRLREAYARLEARGAAKVGTVNAWLVEASPKEGKPDRLYFDQQTGLLIREESPMEGPLGEVLFQIDFADFREVDGVKVPFSIRIPQPAEVGFQVTLVEVKHNGELADAEFIRPKD